MKKNVFVNQQRNLTINILPEELWFHFILQLISNVEFINSLLQKIWKGLSILPLNELKHNYVISIYLWTHEEQVGI